MKRLLDICVALMAGTLLLGPAIVAALAVAATSPGPVLHWSSRSGRHGRPFLMPKFRTMKIGTPLVATDKLTEPASRMTPVGGLLRRLSLDEIPQLWSVLRGEMSMVGPRPALFNQHELIAERHRLGIDELRPGITGWAQVNGRDDISEARKIELDQEYRERKCVTLDLWILWLTIGRVLRSDGIAH
jgi:O-antigen biosynthesis protein WbqP